jgi:hypothetical protein
MWLRRDYITGFAAAYYWSSCEYNDANAWTHYFGNGYQTNSTKTNTNCVRAVRALSI